MIRCAQPASLRSQTNAPSSPSKRATFSAICSLTSRNSASVRAARSSPSYARCGCLRSHQTVSRRRNARTAQCGCAQVAFRSCPTGRSRSTGGPFLEEAGARPGSRSSPPGRRRRRRRRSGRLRLGEIVKSLVFRCDGRASSLLVPGDRRADADKVSGAIGCSQPRIARGGEIEEATGFPPGPWRRSPCPAWTPCSSTARSSRASSSWAGAGSDRHIVGLEPSELVRLSRAKAMDVVGGAA